MKRIATKTMFLLALASMATVVVWAESVHYKHGSPTSTDNVLTLTVAGNLAGLGNGDVRLKVGATANPTANCCNPSDGTNSCKVPGQNPAAATVQSPTVVIPSNELKNGTTPFGVTTDAPTTPIAGAPECSNASWTENITDMAFTQAALRIQQASGGVFTDVLAACITYNPPSSNGAVSSANFSVVVGVFTGGPIGSCSAGLFPSF